MKISKVELVNIKSFYPKVITSLDTSLNLFVGPNGSGKTNLFQIIQGVLNNFIFKHVNDISEFQGKNVRENPYFGKPYEIKMPQESQIVDHFLDPHFEYKEEPSYIKIYFRIENEDIIFVKKVRELKTALEKDIKDYFVNSQVILDPISNLNNVGPDEFDQLKGKSYCVKIDRQNLSSDPFFDNDTDERIKLLKIVFSRILAISNLLYEVTSVINFHNKKYLDFYPVSDYISPNRSFNSSFQSEIYVDFLKNTLKEDGFMKNVNQVIENPQYLPNHAEKLCRLKKNGK